MIKDGVGGEGEAAKLCMMELPIGIYNLRGAN